MEGNYKITPLFDNVLVKKDEVEEKSKTGIITGSDQQEMLVGIVVSVGKEIEEQIKVGVKVMYAPFSGREFGEFTLLAQHDIMGIIQEEIPTPKMVYEFKDRVMTDEVREDLEKVGSPVSRIGTVECEDGTHKVSEVDGKLVDMGKI